MIYGSGMIDRNYRNTNREMAKLVLSDQPAPSVAFIWNLFDVATCVKKQPALLARRSLFTPCMAMLAPRPSFLR